ncbi:hypothetical protein vseg_012313 [Gypsophila vaccaria]
MMSKYLVIAYMLLWMTMLIPLSLGLSKCKIDEQQSLLKFKQSVTKDPMNRLSSWVDNDDCCLWQGVRCDADTGHVIELDLRNLPLYRLDYHVVNCSSKSLAALTSPVLDSALLGLTELARLDLIWNDFNGSQIPGFIGSFRQLRYLNLSEAGFSGQIPPEVGHLSNLVLLDLSSSYWCGTVQYNTTSSTSLSWASNLAKLQTLDMDGVDLSQALNAMPVLSRLESLTMLSLSDCGLLYTRMSNLHILNSSTSFFGALEHLDLSDNGFEGRLTPSLIRNMSSLVSISLGGNNFNGSFPPWLTTLPRLESLDLSDNSFSDIHGTSVWGIMGNPCSFKHLDLGDNQIEGQILEPSTNFSKCDTYNLEYLNLRNNKFRGTLPTFLGQLKKMKHLDLSGNEFHGIIPPSLAGLSALTYLALSYNQLTGSVQDFLGNFTEIEFLDLSSLTLQGTVSSTIADFSKLTVLYLSCDNLNLDPIFDWHPRFQLESFSMPSCGRSIAIPPWLKNQTRLESLDLSNNSMTGEFPNWLWNMTRLGYLDLAYNHFSGPITNLSPNLVLLDLSNNFLRGPLPQHHINGYQLKGLDLHNNKFSGSIPSWLGHLKVINFIDLSTNQLSGKVFEENNGSSLLMSPTLELIDFSENELSGKIMFDSRVQYWDTNMYALVLHRNRLHGQIPSQLCSLTALNILDLSENQVEGSIPPCFGSFKLGEINLLWTIETIRETVKALKETLIGGGTLNTAPIIDLSSNSLTGEIPEELTNLTKLMALNLSYNHLTGGIPERIGNMGSLESLDLSNNRLSGMIPQSLADMKWIEYLNLSNNNLQGKIPTGNQLQTLPDPSIYNGNQGLCGFPLPKCSVTPHATSEEGEGDDEEKDEQDDGHETVWFYLVIMAGVATGFWGVVGTLVLKKRWREAYFGLVEDIMVKCKCLS